MKKLYPILIALLTLSCQTQNDVNTCRNNVQKTFPNALVYDVVGLDHSFIVHDTTANKLYLVQTQYPTNSKISDVFIAAKQ